MTCEPTVKVAKRAITNASPLFPAVTIPSLLISAEGALLVSKTVNEVTSLVVPSEYPATAINCWVLPLPSRTAWSG